jgi:FKBP-type peptidyl-prolyl cis-trans isomerase FklB
MNRTILVFALGLLTAGSFAQVKKPAATNKPAAKPAAATASPFKSNMDSVSYSVGLKIAQNLMAQGFENVNLSLVSRAMSDVKQNKTPLLSEAAVNAALGEFQQKVNTQREATSQRENAGKAAANRKIGQAFMEANAKRPGVIIHPSGVQYEVIKTGTDNTKPTLESTIVFHYHGTLIDGTIFDSSVDRGQPVTYPLRQLVKGWQEVVPLMTVGSKWKLYVPADLAYGDSPAGKAGPGSTMIFDLELISIEK